MEFAEELVDVPVKDTPKVEIGDLAAEIVLEPLTKSISLILNVLEAEVMKVPVIGTFKKFVGLMDPGAVVVEIPVNRIVSVLIGTFAEEMMETPAKLTKLPDPMLTVCA